jgi:hypothetical protein
MILLHVAADDPCTSDWAIGVGVLGISLMGKSSLS